MTDTKTATHRLKPGSWAYRKYGPLEGHVELRRDGIWVFQTDQGHAFDVYHQEIEEVR